jgi:radical SAM protein with 4Fe4S-binding SPASM domain
MVDMAKERESPIRLEWQMIGMRNNEHEIPMAQKMASDMGIHFFVKSFAVTDPKAVPLNKQYQRKLHLKPCMDVYRALFVYYTGEVVPCCYDLDGKAIVGNLTNQSLREVWDSETFVDLRRRIDNAAHKPDEEPALCKSCLKWGHEPFKTSDGQTIWANPDAGQGELAAGDEDLV